MMDIRNDLPEDVEETMLDILEFFFEELTDEEWKLTEEQKEITSKARTILILKNRI